jgi:hypothetical protein
MYLEVCANLEIKMVTGENRYSGWRRHTEGRRALQRAVGRDRERERHVVS